MNTVEEREVVKFLPKRAVLSSTSDDETLALETGTMGATEDLRWENGEERRGLTLASHDETSVESGIYREVPVKERGAERATEPDCFEVGAAEDAGCVGNLRE